MTKENSKNYHFRTFPFLMSLGGGDFERGKRAKILFGMFAPGAVPRSSALCLLLYYLLSLFLLPRNDLQSTSDVHTYEFNMSNLVEHLRVQGDQNKAASYFNIDILKYQASIYFFNYVK